MAQKPTYKQLELQIETLERQIRDYQDIEIKLKTVETQHKREKSCLSAMHETTIDLLHFKDLNEILNVIVTRACAISSTEHGYLHLYEPKTDELVLKIGLGRLRQAVGFRLKAGKGLAGKVWKTKKLVVVDDYSAWPERATDPRFLGLKSVVGVPLKSDTQVYGVIGLAHFDSGKVFNDEAIEILNQFADIASLAMVKAIEHTDLQHELLEREQLEIKLNQRLDFERIVSAISARFVASSDVNADIEKTLAEIGHFSQKCRAYLFLFDGNNETLSNTHEWCNDHVAPQIEQLQNLSFDDFPLVMSPLIAGESVEIKDVSALPPDAIKLKEILEMQGIKSLLLVPLKICGIVKGFIGFDDTQKTGPWNQHDLAMLEVVSDIIGSAIKRSQTQANLKNSEKRYRAVVEDMPAMICRFLPDGTLTFVNNAYCEYFNKDRKELVGQNFFQFIPSEDQDKVRNHFLSLNEKKPAITYEHQVIAPNDQLVWQEWTDRALFDQDKSVVEYQSIGQDITERKQMQEKLIHAEKLASMGELSAGIAHEINNPLTGIMNYAQVLADGTYKQNDLSKITDVIINESARISRIVKCLLAFAKHDYRERTCVSVHKIVSDALDLASVQFKKDFIEIRQNVSDKLPPILANPQQIQQIFLNFLSNSRYALNKKYPGKHKNKYIEVSGELIESNENRLVRMSFYDRGIGISEGVLKQIYNPFFSTKLPNEGTGLGLSISYGIVVDHGGNIDCRSTDGEYTLVTVDFPAEV